MDRPTLALTVSAADGLLRIALDGALVETTTAGLRTWMQAHVPATTRRLVVDLHRLHDVDGVGLGALLAAHRRLAPGAEVAVEGASPWVARALRQSGMGSLLAGSQQAAGQAA